MSRNTLITFWFLGLTNETKNSPALFFNIVVIIYRFIYRRCDAGHDSVPVLKTGGPTKYLFSQAYKHMGLFSVIKIKNKNIVNTNIRAYLARMITPYTIPVIYKSNQLAGAWKIQRTCQNCRVNPLTADPDYTRFFIFY